MGGDSVCFQPFFFKNPQKKQKLSFLPKIQSLLILFHSFFLFFFFFFFNRDRHGCSDKNSLAIFLSFYFSFSLFLSFFFFLFHDFICSSFSFFVQLFRHFYFIFYFLFFIFSIFFLVFVVEAFLHLLPSALGTTRL